jgi:bifunctional non-homologous end joining protein LigD
MPARRPPVGGAWHHELKIEGYRFQIIKQDRRVRLFSRSGLEWTDQHPEFAEAFLRLACRSAQLDGQLVSPESAPSLNPLPWAERAAELVFFAFDLLHWDGEDLRPLPLEERRRRLVHLVTRSELACLHLVQVFTDGARLLDVADRMMVEGIVSKRRAAPYKSDNCRDWVKVKSNAQGRAR